MFKNENDEDDGRNGWIQDENEYIWHTLVVASKVASRGWWWWKMMMMTVPLLYSFLQHFVSSNQELLTLLSWDAELVIIYHEKICL